MESSFDQNFNRNFLISLGVHGLLLILAYFGGQAVVKIFKSNDVEIIRASVRVDVVGMPKFTVQELMAMQRDALPPETEAAAGAKAETKVKDDDAPDVIKKDDLVVEEAGKTKKGSFLNLLSDYSKKKVAKNEKPKGETKGTGNKNLNTLVLEGNRLSKGSALVGDFSGEAASEFAAYVQTLPDAIRQHWKLPSYLLERELRCRIKIFLSQTGELLKLEILESSGESEFDARAEKAIRETAPFPKPSDAVGARLSSSGIILGFPL